MQSAQTVQETVTSLSGDEVLVRAKKFFPSRPSLYAAFVDREGPSFVSFRGQGTEELVIGVTPAEGGTRVTGSTYLFDMQVSRFFATLPAIGSKS
jgi:hypothetical protein